MVTCHAPLLFDVLPCGILNINFNTFQEAVTAHATQLVKGMLGLLTLGPPEVAHLRKDLLIATKHILATELRNSK